MAEILEIVQPNAVLRRHAHIFIGEHKVARCYWRSTRPKPGQVVTVRVVPTGGGGGGGGKNPMRIVLTIAVVIASIYTGGAAAGLMGFTQGTLAYAVAAGAVSMAVSTVGMLVVNAIAPPPKASPTDLGRGGGGLDRASPTLAITGSSNQADPYGPVPRAYGRMRMFPKKAAREYTEVVGNDQYLRCLFDFGYGPLDLTELRIGAIPLEQYEGVELEVRQGWPDDEPVGLYTNTIREDAYSLKISAAGGPQIVETRDGADEITIDVAFNGLVHFGGGGERQSHSVTMRVEWRAVGAVDWTLHAEEAVTGASESAVRKAWRIITGTPGRYQARLTRVTADNTDTSIRDESYLTTLRTIQYSYPVKKAGRCLVAMRIKATDQLNGQVDQFSAIAQAKLRVWNGAAWAWQATRNPAWAFCDVLMGAANKHAVADSRIDLPAIMAWAAACDELAQDGQPKWTFDAVIDYVSTVFETLRDIAASSRAALSMRDGKFSVVRDVPQTVPVQVFTPRNSWGFKASKLFADLPHALRVRYVEPDREWSQQEVTVYADGYTEATASKFETLEMFGCTRRAQAWREGRYHQGVARLRPETFEFQADIEHLVCTRGDLIRVAHDVPLWGGAWGRIRALTLDGDGRVVGCRLDELVIMEAGKSYVLRVRSEGGVGTALSVETHPGEIDQLTFHAAVPIGQEPAEGDLAVFGEAGRESTLLLVKSIHPGPNFTARLVCVDAAPAVHDADTGPVPAYDPNMTRPYVTQAEPPPKPVVAAVASDESVLVRLANGVLQPRIVVSLGLAVGSVAPSNVEIQFRLVGDQVWTRQALFPSGLPEVSIGAVQEGESYDLRLRHITSAGVASDWTVITNHQVVGKTSRPPSPTALYVEKLPGGGLRYRVVGEVAIDHAGWLFRWNPGIDTNWQGASAAAPGVQGTGQFEAAAFVARTFTVMAKSVDTSGNESETAAFAIVQLADLVTDRVVDERDFKALDFPGTITGGVVSASVLVADAADAMFTNPDLSMFGDPAAEMISSFADLVYLPSFTVGRRGFLQLGWDITGPGYGVEVRRPGAVAMFADPLAAMCADPLATVFADPDWLSYVGPFEVAKDDLVQIRVTVPGTTTQGRVDTLDAQIDVPVEVERIEDLVVPPGGIRLPVTRSYEEVVKVSLTVQGGQGYTAIRAEPLDKSTAGPLVRCYDGAGIAVAGLIDADVQGVLLQ